MIHQGGRAAATASLRRRAAAPCMLCRRRQSTSPAKNAAPTASTSSSSSGSSIPGLSAILNHLDPKSSFPTPPASSSSSSSSIVNPFTLVGSEISGLRDNVTKLLGSKHPSLDTIAKYYFQAEGKSIRPTIVLLVSQATNGLAPGFHGRYELEMSGRKVTGDHRSINDPLESRGNDVLNDENPDAPGFHGGIPSSPSAATSAFSNSSSSSTSASSSSSSSSSTISKFFSTLTSSAASFTAEPHAHSSTTSSPTLFPILPSQRRLAEITEMIHVASLLHDDVIDLAATRRSQASAPAEFGNKLSILGGDFLLARASLYLSRLGSNEVVELMASVLANLVEGEVMQIKGNTPENASTSAVSGMERKGARLTPEVFEHYLRKTYLKTASLIAKSARSTVVLGAGDQSGNVAEAERLKDIAYSYGRNLGIAFQLVDDLLDFTATDANLGKPSQGADLKLGLATAPALYAWDEFPEMGDMIVRKFKGEGDVERARELVSRSSGPAQTAALAEGHAQLARDALKGLPESEARDALEGLTRTVLSRTR